MLVFNPHWPLCIPIQVWCGGDICVFVGWVWPRIAGRSQGTPCWGCGALRTPSPSPPPPPALHLSYCRVSSLKLHLAMKWNSWTAFLLVEVYGQKLEKKFLRGFWQNSSLLRLKFGIYVLYSTLLHLPPLRFHCVGGCWDWTQDCCDIVSAVKRSNHSTRSHPHTATSHPNSARSHPGSSFCLVFYTLVLHANHEWSFLFPRVFCRYFKTE
jgi:hypothetical protein